MGIRLGFYYHVPALLQNNQVFVPSYFGRFLDSLAENCDQLIYFAHSPRLDEISILDYALNAKNVTLVLIGIHTTAWERSLFSWRYTRIIREWSEKLDVMLIRGPSPLLPAMVAASTVPTALLLVGDYVTGLDELLQPHLRNGAIRLWSYWNKWRQDDAARYSLTFANSRVLYDEMKSFVPNLREIHTTTLNNADFFLRTDTCQFPPVHLLYTGRLSVAKGLFDIVDSLAILTAGGENLVFDLVGWPEKGEEGIVNNLLNEAERKGVADRIFYHGYKPLGPDLFAWYRNSDIYVIASRFEGFPRTIWEAMANSLPVVATMVGSIPAFVGGAAELVKPRDAAGLATAITRLIHDGERRRYIIHEGYRLAEGNTLENRTKEMVGAISAYVMNRGSTVER